MSAAVCPACGVPVVSGYVRCPKCHGALPRVTFRKPGQTIDPGGTVVEGASRRSIVLVLGAGVAAIAFVAYLGLRGGKTETPAVEQATSLHPQATTAGPATTAEATRAAPTANTRPDPGALAAALERALKKQRLWATVEVIGDHIDVRSGSCSEPALATTIDGVTKSFKAAGMTRLRCLEQSGHVMFVRDL